MQTIDNLTGVFLGRTLIQQKGEIGGSRYVFVKLQGQKNDLVFPTFGGKVMNPFKGAAKIYAGDLFEYRTNDEGLKPEIYILKTYKVKSMSGTTIKIYRDGYKHIPFVGDVLMKAPEKIGAQGGQASVVTAVVKSQDSSVDVWEVTVDTEISGLVDGDILVEAKDKTQTATGTMLVQNINAVAPYDYDFLYYPAATDNNDDFEKARYYLTPALGGTMYVNKMSPMPKCVLDLNKCNINGWFKVEF